MLIRRPRIKKVKCCAVMQIGEIVSKQILYDLLYVTMGSQMVSDLVITSIVMSVAYILLMDVCNTRRVKQSCT